MCPDLGNDLPSSGIKATTTKALYLVPTDLSVSAVVLEAVLQHALVLLHQVVPALVGGRRGAVVAGGDRRGGGGV